VGGREGAGRGEPDLNGDGRLGRLAWLIAGAGAIAAGTALGWDAVSLSAFVTPPAPVRAALVGLAAAVGIWLLAAALSRLAGGPDEAGLPIEARRDVGSMIRAVRLVFLAVAVVAAGAGWLLGHPLPLVVALVIAGVDVLETSFLLLVVNLRSRD
jgi:hypothetical protein